MKTLQLDRRILAIDPTSFGFGFAVLEGPHQLIDFGLVHVNAPHRKERLLYRAAQLIRRFDPDEIVAETPRAATRRSARIQEVLAEFKILAAQAHRRYRGVSRSQVRGTFSVDSRQTTKYEIAIAVSEKFPELKARLPARRKPWMSEHPRMAIFDAVALALTYFARR